MTSGSGDSSCAEFVPMVLRGVGRPEGLVMSPSSQPLVERRREARGLPQAPMGVRRLTPVLPLSDAEVLNVSAHGVAIRTRVPVRVGERLSFTVDGRCPPVLAEVLAAEPLGEGLFRVRCRCLLGEFDAPGPRP